VLPPKAFPSSPDQQRLLGLYKALDPEGRRALISFAEFLVERGLQALAADAGGPSDSEAPRPKAIPRPDTETVIAAIRRLTATYPMLERDRLLHETSELMTGHVMQGRPATEVIDELEIVFRRHYERVNSGDDA
jgi:hypothetical protein